MGTAARGAATGLLALDERVYAGSNDNFFYALEAADGRIAWRWRTGADVVGVPVADERNIYFVSLDNVLRALSRRTGVQRWARLLPIRPTRGPQKVEPALIVSGIAPTLRAYNMATGSLPASCPPRASWPARLTSCLRRRTGCRRYWSSGTTSGRARPRHS